MTILPNLQQQLDQALQENEALKAMLVAKSSPRALSWKVSEKGAISLYGLGRFPVTLYASQLERILDNAVALREFIKTNARTLARK